MSDQWEDDYARMQKSDFYGEWSQKFDQANRNDLSDRTKWPNMLLELIEAQGGYSVDPSTQATWDRRGARARVIIDDRKKEDNEALAEIAAAKKEKTDGCRWWIDQAWKPLSIPAAIGAVFLILDRCHPSASRQDTMQNKAETMKSESKNSSEQRQEGSTSPKRP